MKRLDMTPAQFIEKYEIKTLEPCEECGKLHPFLRVEEADDGKSICLMSDELDGCKNGQAVCVMLDEEFNQALRDIRDYFVEEEKVRKALLSIASDDPPVDCDDASPDAEDGGC